LIASVDENLRRIRPALQDPNGDGDANDSIAKNTLILFTSDNGGTHAPNTPLKGKKGMLTEGGIRVPLIACWPGVIPAGTVTNHTTHCLDFYPTCLELAGGKWGPDPATHPLDGQSFASLLLNPEAKDLPAREPIFYFFPGYMDTRAQPSAAVIDDLEGKRYKVQYPCESNFWELYCLTEDQPEAQNLIATKPEIAATLSKKLHTWLTQEHPTWKPEFPQSKKTGKPSGPPPVLE
jgi:arylsulfatase A-like enzyme